MSKEDVERIKQEHENVVVQELRQAVPHVHEKEIRRLVKEKGDSNEVLELLIGKPSTDNEIQHHEQMPDEEMKESPTDETAERENTEADILATSMEILSLATPAKFQGSEPDVDNTTSEVVPESNDSNNAKSKARQRRHTSAARKDKQSKRAQKEAAKHRKRMEAMGIVQVKESPEQENILKAIVI
jgi:hypothetical protein